MSYVLVLEDDAHIREMLDILLREDGHDVIAVSTCNEALRTIFMEGPPKVAIIDYYLQGETCEPCTDKINILFPAVPIILVTAGSFPETLRARAKANLLIRKPFGIDEFLTVVRDPLSFTA